MGINAYDRVEYNRLNLPSLQELMVAPQYLTDKQEQTQEEIGMLQSEGEVIAGLAEESPEVAARYNQYQGKLNDLLNTLNTKGVAKANIRTKIGEAKSLYVKNIMPVIQADQVRKQDLAALTQANLQGQNLIVDENKFNIDTYVQNNGQSILNNAVNGNVLKQSFAEKMRVLATDINNIDPELAKTGLPYQYLMHYNAGLSQEDITKALMQEFDTPTLKRWEGYIKSSLDSTLQEQGVYEKFADNPQLINRSISMALSGMYAAAGTPQIQMVGDNYGMQVSLMDRKAAQEAAQEAAKVAAKAPGSGRYTKELLKSGWTEKVQKLATSFKGSNKDLADLYTNTGINPYVKDNNGNPMLRPLDELKHELELAAIGSDITNSVYPVDLTAEDDKNLAKIIGSSSFLDKKVKDKLLVVDEKTGIPGGLKGKLVVDPLIGQIVLQPYNSKDDPIILPPEAMDDYLRGVLESTRSITSEYFDIPYTQGQPLNADDINKAMYTRARALTSEATNVRKQAILSDTSYASYTPKEKDELIRSIERETMPNAVKEVGRAYYEVLGKLNLAKNKGRLIINDISNLK